MTPYNVSNHRTIRRRKSIVFESVRVHPGNTVVGNQTRSSRNRFSREEDESYRPVCIPVLMRTERTHYGHIHPQFLPDLTNQAVFRGFAGVNLATREFPISRKRVRA